MPASTIPLATPAIRFALADASDLEQLIDIRIAAMRDSLQAVGRFDPARARERFQSGFSPTDTRFVLYTEKRAGFVVVKKRGDHLLLDHLYILPFFQGKGIGSAILTSVFADADAACLELRVGALKGSDANRFYQRHGFVRHAEQEWDIYYVRPAK